MQDVCQLENDQEIPTIQYEKPLLNAIKKINFLEALFVTFVFTIAAVYSSFIGSKGFAGFDLAPIVSLAQAMYSGQSFHDFVDNAFSPGFAVILKLMAVINDGVTWNLFTNGLIIYTSIFAVVGTYYHLNSKKSNIIIFYAFYLPPYCL